jgi:hypothetical protein
VSWQVCLAPGLPVPLMAAFGPEPCQSLRAYLCRT